MNDKDYLKAGERFLEKSLFDDIYNGKDPFNYIHANTAIPKLLSSCYAYLATGDDYYLTVAVFHILFFTCLGSDILRQTGEINSCLAG